METLKDKIAQIEEKIVENNKSIDEAKAEFDAKVASIKEENKKLVRVVKKLQDTEASITSILGADAE